MGDSVPTSEAAVTPSSGPLLPLQQEGTAFFEQVAWDSSPSHCVYVRGLREHADSDALRSKFARRFGPVDRVFCKEGKGGKCFAFVTFLTQYSAMTAIEARYIVSRQLGDPSCGDKLFIGPLIESSRPPGSATKTFATDYSLSSKIANEILGFDNWDSEVLEHAFWDDVEEGGQGYLAGARVSVTVRFGEELLYAEGMSCVRALATRDRYNVKKRAIAAARHTAFRDNVSLLLKDGVCHAVANSYDEDNVPKEETVWMDFSIAG